MIGKIKRGSSFRKVCEYLLNPDKADQPKIISGNLVSTTPEMLAAEFEMFAALNQRVKMTVKHFSLSFAPEDLRYIHKSIPSKVPAFKDGFKAS